MRLDELIEERLSRREILKGVGAGGAMLALAGVGATACGAQPVSSLTFKDLPQSIGNGDAVAPGYSVKPVVRWGDAVFADAPPFEPAALTPAAQERQFGYNNDFLAYFPLPRGESRSDRGLLFANHEYTNGELMFPGYDPAQQTAQQTAVEMAAHGASVIEVERVAGAWRMVEGSSYARRITAMTPVRLSGPAAGHPRLQTNGDPTGTLVLGTLGNCAGGTTPWGTALTCEENVDVYFGGTPKDEAHAARYKVMGFADASRARPWYKSVSRFDVALEPNEPSRFGWVVEIDPYDPQSPPVKRTALGRFKHEAATTVIGADGRLVVYMGDDERYQYLYRFVTAKPVNLADGAANADLLDEGTLYVARFDKDGVSWLPLVHGQEPLTGDAFASQADVLIDARLAAKALGATPMDRPEDVETDPATGRVYVILTNNTKRKSDEVDGANPRAGNTHGHILELVPPAAPSGLADHAAVRFQWNVFLLAGDAASGGRYGAGTKVWMSSPDNCAFDPKGRLWIASDQGKEQAGHGIADGMFACDTDGEGRALLKFFYAVPRGAECCGPCFTPDGKTLFVAVQHPGEGDRNEAGQYESRYEAPSTRWPDFKPAMPPRPAVVAITKDDGGPIGG